MRVFQFPLLGSCFSEQYSFQVYPFFQFPLLGSGCFLTEFLKHSEGDFQFPLLGSIISCIILSASSLSLSIPLIGFSQAGLIILIADITFNSPYWVLTESHMEIGETRSFNSPYWVQMVKKLSCIMTVKSFNSPYWVQKLKS